MIRIAALLLWQASAASEAAAQDGEKKQEREVVVTASPLKPVEWFDTPYSVDVLRAEDLQERRLSRTIPDALKEVPGVSVQKTAYGHGSPFLRGFTGFRNVLLVDGIRMNNSVWREGPNQYWNTIDSFLIDRLEVIRGPSSVLYGSDSIGGTVVAYTKEPGDFSDGFHPHERTYYRYAGAERSHVAREETWGNWDRLGWFVGGTYKDFNDLDGGRHVGEQSNTGYDEYDADAKVAYKTGADSKLILAYQRTRQDDVPRTHRTNQAKPWHGTVAGTDRRADFDQERDLIYLQFRARPKGSLVDALDANVSWHRTAETFDRTRSNGAKEFRGLEVETPAIWAKVGKRTGVGYFTFGVEYYLDRVSSEGHDTSSSGVVTRFDRGEVADDTTYSLFGVYLQDEIALGDFEAVPGIRYSRAEVEADEVDPNPSDAIVFDDLDDTYSAVTGSLRLLYHLGEHWNVVGGWGQGFRAPSLDDSTAIKLVMSGSLDLPAEELDPEKSHTFDLGLRTQHDTFEVSAFVFYTILRDFIRRVPDGDYNGDGVTDNTKDNFADGWVYGVELQGLLRITEEISIWSDLGYAKGEAEAIVAGEKKDQPLDKVNPMIAHVGARFQPKESTAWIEGVVTFARHQEHLSPSDETDTQRIPPDGTPGYTVYTLRGGYRPAKFVNVTAAVENVTNKDYRIHGSGQNEPGTNFILGLDVRF